MKAIQLICLLLLCFIHFATGQSAKLVWANQMKGSSFDVCQALALDAAGNVYVTGYFSTTTDFDPGTGVFNLQSLNAEDIFLAKYRPDGSLVWAKSIGDFRYQAGYSITLDSTGNIYMTGIFFGSLDFDPGPGVSTLSSAGNEDVFICKFNNNGDFIWARKIGGPSNDFSNAVVVDRNGNIYFNGYFDGTSDFDPGTGNFNMTSVGSTDIYICKLSSAGNFIWARQIGGLASEGAYSIGLDAQNNVYTTGFFWGTVDFDPGPGNFNLTSNGFGDGFILKLNPGGNFVRAGSMGGNGRVRCNNLKFANTDAIYVTGYFDGNTDFDIGPASNILSSSIGDEDIFIVKYDLNFNLLWAKQITGPSFQRSIALDVDADDNVYATGHYNGSADFDPGPGNRTLIATGDPDIFVLKLNKAGEFVWVAHGTGSFYGSGYALKVDKQNNIYVAGTFEGTKDFDPGPDEYKLTSAGESEIFIEKLRQCANAAITTDLTINTCTAYTLNGYTYDSSGNYTNVLLNDMGCDSIITNLNLTITRATNNITANICQGQAYFAGGKMQTKTGIYYDTVKTVNGCDSVIITNLTVNQLPRPNLGTDRNLCQGQNLLLNPGQFNSYLWQDNSTQATYSVSTPGTYRVTVTNQFNCAATARVTIRRVVSPPVGFLPADQQLCTGDVLKLKVPGYRNYSWSTGAMEPGIEIRNAGTYSLIVTDFNNCIGSDTVTITQTTCIPISIPSAFTPNNDGKNDLFRPIINVAINNYHLQIFNRSGQLIFRSKNIEEGWDGRFKGQPLDPGTYIYHISISREDGNVSEHKGAVLVIR